MTILEIILLITTMLGGGLGLLIGMFRNPMFYASTMRRLTRKDYLGISFTDTDRKTQHEVIVKADKSIIAKGIRWYFINQGRIYRIFREQVPLGQILKIHLDGGVLNEIRKNELLLLSERVKIFREMTEKQMQDAVLKIDRMNDDQLYDYIWDSIDEKAKLNPIILKSNIMTFKEGVPFIYLDEEKAEPMAFKDEPSISAEQIQTWMVSWNLNQLLKGLKDNAMQIVLILCVVTLLASIGAAYFGYANSGQIASLHTAAANVTAAVSNATVITGHDIK